MVKIGNMNINKVLAFTGLFLAVVLMLTLKICGATELPLAVEKIGFCKTYGDEWKYIEDDDFHSNTCLNRETKEEISFSDEEFRDVCPKNDFLNLRFFSECFRSGGSRWNN